MDNVIIFGGSGFIGTHLSKSLLRDGFTVYVVDIKPPRFQHDRLVFLNADVRDLSNLDVQVNFKRAYNLAAVHTTPGHPQHEYYETNILGALSVCRFAERNNINELIFTSSISVYGPDESQKDENSILAPTSAYGYSKMFAETVHRDWLGRSSDRTLTIVRPAVVFGPGEGGNFTRLATMLRKGFFIFPGRKDTIKACIYVDDLLFAIEAARKTQNNYELFNGAYPQRYTLFDIVSCFKSNYFQNAKLFLFPKSAVLLTAKLLNIFNFLNIGIHPDRVMKLIKSTNIYPSWLKDNSVQLPGDLESALKRWSDDTNGKFD